MAYVHNLERQVRYEWTYDSHKYSVDVLFANSSREESHVIPHIFAGEFDCHDSDWRLRTSSSEYGSQLMLAILICNNENEVYLHNRFLLKVLQWIINNKIIIQILFVTLRNVVQWKLCCKYTYAYSRVANADWVPYSGLPITMVWDVTPCRLVEMYWRLWKSIAFFRAYYI